MNKMDLLKVRLKEIFDFLLDEQFEIMSKIFFMDGKETILAINIFIDITNNYISKNMLKELFAGFDWINVPNSIREYVYCQVKDNDEKYLLKNNRAGLSKKEKHQYVRIMSTSYFLQEICNILKLNYDSDSENEIIKRFFIGDNLNQKEKLGIYKSEWRGKLKNVWVMNKAEYDKIKESGTNDNIAKDLRNRLGFLNYRGKFIAIIYPFNFTRTSFVKPTFLDAHSSHLFLSISSELEWGKTYSLDEMYDGIGERVHGAFRGLDDDFEGEYIGQINTDNVLNIDSLIKEGLKRTKL